MGWRVEERHIAMTWLQLRKRHFGFQRTRIRIQSSATFIYGYWCVEKMANNGKEAGNRSCKRKIVYLIKKIRRILWALHLKSCTFCRPDEEQNRSTVQSWKPLGKKVYLLRQIYSIGTHVPTNPINTLPISVTRSGDLLDFGRLLNAFGNT